MAVQQPHYARMVTRAEACEVLQVSLSTLGRLIKEGKLYAVKVGSQVRIPAPALEAFMAGQKYAPPSTDDTSTWPPTPAMW